MKAFVITALRALLIVLLLGTTASSHAATIATFRTGVDETNGNALLADDAADTTWSIVNVTGAGDGSTPRSATTAAGSLPGAWSGNAIAGTGFITRGTSVVGTDGATYTYQTTFTLDKINFSSFSFSGSAWADNTVSVILNGNLIGTSANLSTLNFSTVNQSYFLNGLNTLQLSVFNNVTDTGVSFSGLITATPVPEPHEWAMMFIVFGFFGWHYRSRWQPLLERARQQSAA
ncbi:MAG: hypothetical protein ACO1QS_15130 [Verrucomicrobiota bacterium]